MIEDLKWEDMMLIHRCIKDAMNYYRISSLNTIEGQQKIYEDALKRFVKEKGNKYQQKQNVFEVGDIISDGKTIFRIDSIIDDNYVAPDGEVIPFFTAHRYFYIHKKHNNTPIV
jgi:hypothetical protein